MDINDESSGDVMSVAFRGGTAFDLVEVMKRRGPEYLDLMTAQNDADFEKAFDALLQRAVVGLETNKKSFATLDEVGLSGALALALSIPGLSVTQETNSNGHVDITVEVEHCLPMRKKLGEAKIYDGPAYHVGGLEQLLQRYTTGREGRGLLIVYVRQRDIAGLIEKLRIRLNDTRPCQQQGETLGHVLKWSFLSRHAHSCGEILEVGHVGCNMYVEPASS